MVYPGMDSSRSRRLTLSGLAAALACAVAAAASAAAGADGPAPGTETPTATVPLVEAGTPAEDPARERWNRVVLLATPRFSSGDVEGVSTAIRDTVTRFTFAVLATVRRHEADRHELVEVGVAHCTPLNGRLTVVAPNTPVAGFTTDFLGRQILGAKHKGLAEITCVGRHGRAVAFDVPSIFLRDDSHDDLVVRHLVRIDPRSGTITTCAWLLEPTADGGRIAVEQPLRIIDEGTREERAIHVDGGLFTFGMPTKRAFALEDLPPGRRLAWPTSLRDSAAASAYAEAALDRLSTEIEAADRSLRTLRSAER